jgi:hypothetical protein
MNEAPEISLLEKGPVISKPLTEQLLHDIARSFPLKAPRKDDTIETLMWSGGQQEVVEWIKEYINQLVHPT